MPFDLDVTLVDHPGAPTAFGPVGANLSRHHILGQKYLQVLLALARKVAVGQSTLERFAGRPITASAPWPAAMPNAFVWSPYDLFIGPKAQRRVFDPSSGVEQQKPRSFPEGRWAALKAVPEFLATAGVPLEKLVAAPVGVRQQWRLRRAPGTDEVTQLIKTISSTVRADHVYPHGLDESDWAFVREVDVRNFHPTTAEDVQSIHRRFQKQIVHGVPFADALASDAYRFLLVP
ncbi:hypothetical protein [Pseudonocardia sp. TRM90224]|uniref:hypothetical protein n=1 Tax=Pseudonocardia sp. TRM90224 TaxID=2812678 RepID=UPI001E4480F5|nr:hypothetical protein [Pseudonocardia sp. TRM90224]